MLFLFLTFCQHTFLEFSKHDISFTSDEFLQCLILKESLLFDYNPFNNNYSYMQGGFKCLSLYYITFPFRAKPKYFFPALQRPATASNVWMILLHGHSRLELSFSCFKLWSAHQPILKWVWNTDFNLKNVHFHFSVIFLDSFRVGAGCFGITVKVLGLDGGQPHCSEFKTLSMRSSQAVTKIDICLLKGGHSNYPFLGYFRPFSILINHFGFSRGSS